MEVVTWRLSPSGGHWTSQAFPVLTSVSPSAALGYMIHLTHWVLVCVKNRAKLGVVGHTCDPRLLVEGGRRKASLSLTWAT